MENQEFQPTHFTGLNRDEARPLIDYPVEYSKNGRDWKEGVLINVLRYNIPFQIMSNPWKDEYRYISCHYIRICPEKPKKESHTIQVKEAELPKPLTEPLEEGSEYWRIDQPYGKLFKDYWINSVCENLLLEQGHIYLSKEDAQAWLDWWTDNVVKQLLKTDSQYQASHQS